MTAYDDFLRGKFRMPPSTGIARPPALVGDLFDFQSALTTWSLKKGRAAIFADTGLGKMRMELAWAHAVHQHTKQPVMILAPLAVARQIADEAALVGIHAQVCREAGDMTGGINVANYDRLHKFNRSDFIGTAPDESSCIKHYDTAIFKDLTQWCQDMPFILPATATPAPNDWTELGTHAELLGICTRQEMLAEFFTHDGGDTSVWRLKGHARHVFWKWVATWGAMVRRPSDLGFDDARYKLPPLELIEHVVDYEMPTFGQLFANEAQSLSERRQARRESLAQRVNACIDQIRLEPNEPWLIWCDLNAEQDALKDALGAAAFSVQGSDSVDAKEAAIAGWLAGDRKHMISKPSIMGWGLNFQHSARMGFVGVTDSYEAFYQAVRREWRFGQKRAVHAHIFASKAEGTVVANLKRKEFEAKNMAEQLSAETREAVMAEVTGTVRETNDYRAQKQVHAPAFLKVAA